MDLMVLVENVFTSRAQWWVMREDGVWKGQEQVAPLLRPSDPFADLADAQPAGGGGGGMAECTSGSYLPRTPAAYERTAGWRAGRWWRHVCVRGSKAEGRHGYQAVSRV